MNEQTTQTATVNPLPDLAEIVRRQFEAVAASGVVERMVEERLTKTIEDVLKEQLRDWSDFGKALSEKVKGSLQIADMKDLPNYGQFMSNIIAKNVDRQLHGKYAAQLAKDVEELFVDAPAEITLADLIAAFKEHITKDVYREHDDEISLHMEFSYGSWWIALDKSSGKGKYQCDMRFMVMRDTGKVFALYLDGSEIKKEIFVGPFDNFERLLMRIYVMGTKVIIEEGASEHDFDLSLRDYD